MSHNKTAIRLPIVPTVPLSRNDMGHKSPTWAIERRVFPVAEEERLIRALKSRQINFHEFVGHDFRRIPGLAEAAVPRGSCYFVREMSLSSDWPVNLWGCPSQFECSRYFPSFAGHTLNGKGRFMSLGELLWAFPKLVREFGDSDNRLFIRPDDGFKSFEGALVSPSEFESWANQLQLLQVPSHTRVLVAPPTHLAAEWRVELVDGCAVASSQYKPTRLPGSPMEVTMFAERRHREASWPLGAYAMDIARTESDLKIVEVGSLLCVAFYESDAGAIVDAVQSAAEAAVRAAP